MYVMCVCMYARMCACMFVCNACMYVCISFMGVRNVGMCICVYVCMYVCVYVCMGVM